MAELKLKQIVDKLNTEFSGGTRKLVFWYDEKGEFSEDIDGIEIVNAPFPKPPVSENHLEDTMLYSKRFYADRVSILLVDCYVGEFENISDFGKLTDEKKVSPTLFVFIAPRKLSKQEEIRLAEMETEQENAQYVRGVREGWSILFLGAIKKYIIEPGKISREQIVQKIPRSFKEIKPDIKYVLADGSAVF